MKKNKPDWYSYLTEDFKLPQKAYSVSDKAVFDCAKCEQTSLVRINNAAEKIAKLGYFECSKCRKRASAERAREACLKKHDGKNPFELEHVKKKIRESNLKKYGLETLLLDPNIRKLGVDAIKKTREKSRGFAYPDFSNLTPSEKSNSYDRVRNRLDRAYNLRKRVYGFINRSLKKANSLEVESKTKLLKNMNYTIEQLVSHLESQFSDGMSWDNRSEWHVDHIVPLSKFKMTSLEDLRRANALNNLRPMWKAENLKKRAKLPHVLLVVGCFGVGKTTVCSTLGVPFFSHDSGHDETDLAKSDAPMVVFETAIKMSSYLRKFKEFFKVTLVVVDEEFTTVETRIKLRRGHVDEAAVRRRMARAKKLSAVADFSGTADECGDFLRKLIKRSDECRRE